MAFITPVVQTYLSSDAQFLIASASPRDEAGQLGVVAALDEGLGLVADAVDHSLVRHHVLVQSLQQMGIMCQ